MKSLGLTGRFIYIELATTKEFPFTIHLDFKIASRNNQRISLSNLFKTVQKPNDFVIQFPIDLEEKWTVVCLDILKILEMTENFPEGFELEGSHTLKSFTVCSTMQCRGIFTSDNLYQWHNLPSDLSFKKPADMRRDEWEAGFNWSVIPCLDEDAAHSSAEKIK